MLAYRYFARCDKKYEEKKKKGKKGVDKRAVKWYTNKAVGKSNKFSQRTKETQKKFCETP